MNFLESLFKDNTASNGPLSRYVYNTPIPGIELPGPSWVNNLPRNLSYNLSLNTQKIASGNPFLSALNLVNPFQDDSGESRIGNALGVDDRANAYRAAMQGNVGEAALSGVMGVVEPASWLVGGPLLKGLGRLGMAGAGAFGRALGVAAPEVATATTTAARAAAPVVSRAAQAPAASTARVTTSASPFQKIVQSATPTPAPRVAPAVEFVVPTPTVSPSRVIPLPSKKTARSFFKKQPSLVDKSKEYQKVQTVLDSMASGKMKPSTGASRIAASLRRTGDTDVADRIKFASTRVKENQGTAGDLLNEVTGLSRSVIGGSQAKAASTVSGLYGAPRMLERALPNPALTGSAPRQMVGSAPQRTSIGASPERLAIGPGPGPTTAGTGAGTSAGASAGTSAGASAGRNLPPLIPPSSAAAAESAAAAGRSLPRWLDIATGGGSWKTQALATALGLAPALIESTTDIDVPDWLEALLALSGGAAVARGGAGVIKSGVSNIKKSGEADNILKNIGMKIKGATQVAGGGALVPVGAGSGLLGAATSMNMGPLAQPNMAEAEAQAQGVPSVSIPQGGVVGQGRSAQVSMTGTPEDQAETQLQAIDSAFQAAVNELTASYGGVEEALRALDTGDPALARALSSLDSQYRKAQRAVAAEYSAAVGDIAGYQEQVDALMQEVAAEQAADFEAAAGGLENINVGVDPATAAMAAGAGVSDTAVGGGAITGAGLARGLAGAAAAEGAASRIRTGSELAGLVAATRQDAAAQQAALSQQYLAQRYQAEVEAAQQEAARRQAIEDALIQNEAELGQALSQLNLQRAQQLGQFSPQDFAAATGQNRQLPVPQWFGGKLEGDFNAPVAGIPDKVVENELGQKAPAPVTVGDINGVLDQLYAVSSVARELYMEGRTADAYAYLSDFYTKLVRRDWLNRVGVPTTAYDAYVDLFGQPPV